MDSLGDHEKMQPEMRSLPFFFGTRSKGTSGFSTEEAFRIIDDIAGYAKPVIVLSGESHC